MLVLGRVHQTKNQLLIATNSNSPGEKFIRWNLFREHRAPKCHDQGTILAGHQDAFRMSEPLSMLAAKILSDRDSWCEQIAGPDSTRVVLRINKLIRLRIESAFTKFKLLIFLCFFYMDTQKKNNDLEKVTPCKCVYLGVSMLKISRSVFWVIPLDLHKLSYFTNRDFPEISGPISLPNKTASKIGVFGPRSWS